MFVHDLSAEKVKQRVVAGWLEKVTLFPSQIILKAKLDSGAKTSSIHAENIEYFEREDKTWVRFELPEGKKKVSKNQRIVEAPLYREVLIKRHNMLSATRPVIEMTFCINHRFYTAQFTLADRTNYNYPVLLGRRFLKNKLIIDPAETFLHDPKNNKHCINPQ